jgi:hypothetical protein
MTGEHLAVSSENHDSDSKRRISRLDSNALIQGLERLRECLEQRLVQLEAMARERAEYKAADRPEFEQRLQERISEYEEAQHRLRAQAERREQEWQAALEQLEDDRALLAKAWEQLEQERVEVASAAPQGNKKHPRVERGSSPPARPHTELPDASSDHVAHAVLKQFQALRNDVRRNARQRG